MKKSEEIQKQIKDLDNEIKAIQLKIRQARVALLAAVETESDFKVGEKVLLYKTYFGGHKKLVGEGIFAGHNIDHYGDVKPDVFKVKKDGTASKNEWSWYDFTTIEKI